MIDRLNPNLRTIEVIDGIKRKREFYAMEAREAYDILENIASINGLRENLVLVRPSENEIQEEIEALEIRELDYNRHHFKDIEFNCSLTNKKYKGTTSEDGTLAIIDLETGIEVPNNSNPSKKSIVGKAIEDLGYDVNRNETLYQRYHRLMKILVNN